MTEKGGIFTKKQLTQKGLLESKLHKSILVDCVFINSMLKIPHIINYAEQFKVPPLNTPPHPPSWFICPCIAYWFHGISEDFYQIKSNILS
jgi:hypothetical protein